MYGCGSQAPALEHQLDRIHRDMYKKIELAFFEASNIVKKIIDKN